MDDDVFVFVDKLGKNSEDDYWQEEWFEHCDVGQAEKWVHKCRHCVWSSLCRKNKKLAWNYPICRHEYLPRNWYAFLITLPPKTDEPNEKKQHKQKAHPRLSEKSYSSKLLTKQFKNHSSK